MDGFDASQLIADLAAATTPSVRFAVLTRALATLGLDTINYGYFDLRAAEVEQADILFLTTMKDDWMRYYFDRNVFNSDSHVLRVRAGKITPYLWGESVIRKLDVTAERVTALESMEAGLRSTMCVPLPGLGDPFRPVAGINLGSSMPETEYKKVMREHGATLMSIAYLFHNTSIGLLQRARAGALTVRERDALRYLADGKRQDAIAHAMGLARVTVELHLREARRKLGVRTLNEAIAKAYVTGEITLG